VVGRELLAKLSAMVVTAVRLLYRVLSYKNLSDNCKLDYRVVAVCINGRCAAGLGDPCGSNNTCNGMSDTSIIPTPCSDDLISRVPQLRH
jgi:hypothetical protein